MTEPKWPATWDEFRAAWKALPDNVRDFYRTKSLANGWTLWQSVREYPSSARRALLASPPPSQTTGETE